MTPAARSRPISLQTRLMVAVIGIVSLILIIVAIATSATLGGVLNDRLQDQLRSTSTAVNSWTTTELLRQSDALTAEHILTGRAVLPGTLVAVATAPGVPTSLLSIAASGAVVTDLGGTGQLVKLTAKQLAQLQQALAAGSNTTVVLDDLGSYQIALTGNSLINTVVGLPRTDMQQTMSRLFAAVTLATFGGLILLAVTTAVTIRVGLRPLRSIAATATRVAHQPLDHGVVSISERVSEEEADPSTESGRVGAALNRLLDHVDSSLAARGRNEEQMRSFIADASHELRTPLASIRGYSELGLRALPQEPPAAQTPTATATTALERIHAQSLRMTSLVEDLLLLARLGENTELVYQRIDLAVICAESIADAQPTSANHQWRLNLPQEPVEVSGDPGRMHQVLTNLLANARSHTPAGTVITLTLETATSSPGWATIRVHDTGPGIPADMQSEMFNRFSRGDTSRTRNTGGSGLGLAIAKAIVEAHQGRISVTSQPGNTEFMVMLPLTKNASTS